MLTLYITGQNMTPVQVEELNLDNVCAAQISGLSQGFTSLKHLSIINTGLTTLDSFPAMHALERLELSDNKLSNDLKVLSGCPSLRHLSLAGNRITSLETLKPLCALDHLTSLDLFNCPVTQQEDYRTLTFNLLPSLVYLDGVDREGHEALSGSEEEGNSDVQYNADIHLSATHTHTHTYTPHHIHSHKHIRRGGRGGGGGK